MNSEKIAYFKRGRIITGQWEKNSYRVVKPLGKGGTAAVFLVQTTTGLLRAMKISSNIDEINHEYRILLFLNNCSEIKNLRVVPQVYELDDFHVDGKSWHFIITEYCPGRNLMKSIGRLNSCEASDIGVQVADFLERLHATGFIYGDLKPGNIIYDFQKKKVFITDCGSVTRTGKLLNQYTPGYDRTNWDLGPRIADERYDIFSLGILLAALTTGKIPVGLKGLNQLTSWVSREAGPRVLKNVIIDALEQKLSRCWELRERLIDFRTEARKAKLARQRGQMVSFLGVISLVSALIIAFN